MVGNDLFIRTKQTMKFGRYVKTIVKNKRHCQWGCKWPRVLEQSETKFQGWYNRDIESTSSDLVLDRIWFPMNGLFLIEYDSFYEIRKFQVYSFNSGLKSLGRVSPGYVCPTQILRCSNRSRPSYVSSVDLDLHEPVDSSSSVSLNKDLSVPNVLVFIVYKRTRQRGKKGSREKTWMGLVKYGSVDSVKTLTRSRF